MLIFVKVLEIIIEADPVKNRAFFNSNSSIKNGLYIEKVNWVFRLNKFYRVQIQKWYKID